MSVQFNDMIITIKRNENGFVIISECKTANCNNKVTEVKTGYYSAVTFWVNSTFLPYEQLSYNDNVWLSKHNLYQSSNLKIPRIISTQIVDFLPF